ncbi:MAG: flagellar hook-length control protein FliK [Paraperlucidibaca sp.]|nr:flagellar hook-length control protein FliK [Paraperlucidibaca sp.]
MSTVSIFSDSSSATAASASASSNASANAANASSNPFVALLSGLMGPNGDTNAAVALPVTADADGSLSYVTTSSVDLLSGDTLADLPDDIAAALADVAQALGQLKSSLTGTKAPTSETVDSELSADDALLAGTVAGDQLLTPLQAPMVLRQDLGVIAGVSSAASTADDAVLVAAGGMSARSNNAASDSALTATPDDVAEALAKPTSSTSFAATLNSTADTLAAAKESALVSPALSVMKEAMQQAGVSGDQADQLLNLSAQGQSAPSANVLAANTTATAAPTASQWTVPGHALLDNSAWSSAMADRLTWLGQNGMTSASLHITPDDLGPIHVRIQMGEDGAKVAFSADHHDTQGLIERMLPKLTAAFEAQGIRLDDVRVQSGASQAAQMDFNDQQGGHEAAAQQQAQAGSGSSEQRAGSAKVSDVVVGGVSGSSAEPTVVTTSSSNSQLDAYA